MDFPRCFPNLLSLACLAQDILAYEAGSSLTVAGVELGPGDIKVLRDFKPPEGSQPGEWRRGGRQGG